jgi:signal recognition particle subunit SRP19
MVSKGLDKFVLWPRYFDASLSRASGRRVKAGHAVKDPDAKWIEVAAKRLGLDPELDEAARHPGTPGERTGRVLVARKGKKESVVDQVGAKMRESQDSHEKR